MLAQARLSNSYTYTYLADLASNHFRLRAMMGYSSGIDDIEYQFEYQQIYDNVSKLSDDFLNEINDLVVEFGNGTFKKKEQKHRA